jgi:hypothetical protein
MVILLIAAGWIIVLSLVAGLCVAAQRGERQLERGASRPGERPSGHRGSPGRPPRPATAAVRPSPNVHAGREPTLTM